MKLSKQAVEKIVKLFYKKKYYDCEQNFFLRQTLKELDLKFKDYDNSQSELDIVE